MITTADLAWIAGLVEGEGYFGFASGRTPRIVVHMTDRDIIERLAAFWGCTVRARSKPKQPHHKTQYKAQVSSGAAIAWAATLYYWLGVRRRARVRELLVMWKNSGQAFKYRTHCPKGHPYAGWNLIVRPGHRSCRTCMYAATARHAKAHPRAAGRLAYMQQWRKDHPERMAEYRRRAASKGDARQLQMGL